LKLIQIISFLQQDSQFVVDYCINAPWPLYETAQEMLNYAKVRVRLFFCQFVLHASVQLEMEDTFKPVIVIPKVAL